MLFRSTDGDGIADEREDINGNGKLDAGETDPYNADTDGGGESDGSEITGQRDPTKAEDDLTFDADGDGVVNGLERKRKTDPLKKDTDGDGIEDRADAFPIDNRYQQDANKNNLPDEWEALMKVPTTTTENVASDDTDNDGLSNAEEFAHGTDPLLADTDHDGINDGQEVEHGTNPRENPCLAYEKQPPFNDTIGHWSLPYGTILRGVTVNKNLRLLQGYSNGQDALLHPDQAITRYEFLKLALLSSCINTEADLSMDTQSFSDVPRSGRKFESVDAIRRRNVIYTGVHEGIIKGYDDGTFRPDAPITRAEAAHILVAAMRLDFDALPTKGSSSFADVPESAWFAYAINILRTRDILHGYNDGTCRPSQLITRGEAAKIIAGSLRQNPLTNGYVLPDPEEEVTTNAATFLK